MKLDRLRQIQQQNSFDILCQKLQSLQMELDEDSMAALHKLTQVLGLSAQQSTNLEVLQHAIDYIYELTKMLKNY